jgi:hypothetical protein
MAIALFFILKVEVNNMMIIKNKQRIQKRLGISFPILREFCQQHKITELSVFGSMPEYPK